jgi:CRISPR/Cas system CSM-associated protein Csm3 (group 7 of RAMP superfamily)
MEVRLKIKLLSDTTFGRGDGVAGLVDSEVEYDAATGLPFVRGRTLKGLLVEECANILYSVSQLTPPRDAWFSDSAAFLFGQSGQTGTGPAGMRIGPGRLPEDLVKAVSTQVSGGGVTPAQVLDSLTAIRRQTAVDVAAGAPEEGSLRSMRVVPRNTTFEAVLTTDYTPPRNAMPLLAACVLALRRGGTGRNRGRGKLQAALLDDNGQDITQHYFRGFQRILEKENESSKV